MRVLARVLRRALVPPGRPPDFVIGDHYMDRWYLLPRNRFLNVYLHHVRHSDDDRALHDHPWWSASLCLKGWMQEVVRGDEDRVRHVEQGDVVLRSTKFAHRLIIPIPKGPYYDGCWTLFITGPVVRVWGFYCPQGWRPWHEFVKPGDRGQKGRGCD